MYFVLVAETQGYSTAGEVVDSNSAFPKCTKINPNIKKIELLHCNTALVILWFVQGIAIEL